MAISDSVQTLSAAFSFGILLQAATGALFIYYRGHGSTIFQDGRRLVLVLFLLFAALWAQIDFVNLLLPATMATGCQATLIVSTMFDQLARVGMEQFLLWSVGHGTRLTAERLILQAVLLARLVAGGLLVGFTRPQFEPVCLAQTSVMPIAIVVLALDAVIVGVLLVRAMSLGMFRNMSGKDGSEQNKALIFSILGFGFWTAMSIPMILGVSTIMLLLRTVLPAIGLLVLVGIVTMYPHALLSDREKLTTPEASSPFQAPLPPARQIFRESVNNDGSPISNHAYAKNGSLFVVNPSSTPRDSPRGAFANSPRSSRGFTKLNEEVTVRDLDATPERPDRPERSAPGYRGSSGVFPSMLSAPTVSAMAPQIRPNISVNTKLISGPTSLSGPSPAQQKRGLFGFSKSASKPNIRSLGISQPVAIDTDTSETPFARMQTIDLATAALNERERRDGAAARAKLVANRPAPQPPSMGMSSQEALRKSISVKRKETPLARASTMPMPTIPASVSSSMNGGDGSTTSASLSPGRDEVRRRSPRQNNMFEKTPVLDAKTGRPVQLQRKNTLGGLPSNPRATRLMNTGPTPVMAVPQQTIMFMNDIVYDNPSVVKTIIREAKTPNMYGTKKQRPLKSSIDSTSSIKSAGSIIHRPRPYKRDQSTDRAIFPSEPSPGHRRSRSGSSIIGNGLSNNYNNRRSIFTSNPGSPTQLPPLPVAPPTTAADLKRLLPNDTKSMTFDEKIELLFPAPPTSAGGNGNGYNPQRRSSVPSLPRVPSVFMFDENFAPQSPTEEQLAARRASKRTTLPPLPVSIPNLEIESSAPPPTIPTKSSKRESVRLSQEKSRQTYRFSANTYRTLADEVGETWIPGIPDSHTNALLPVPQRQSVLDDMRKSHFTVTTNTSSEMDESSYWGSVHDEVPAIDIRAANARSTFIGGKSYWSESKKSSMAPSMMTVDSAAALEGEEIMTVMLDSEPSPRHEEEARKSFLHSDRDMGSVDDNRRSFFLDAGEALDGDEIETSSSMLEKGWHRRIGDELPTFSERKAMRKSRKMPPPTPLILNRNGRQATVVVRATEPSPPADSPERAIAEIQAQLKRFEEPSRGSVGSLLRGLPGHANGEAPANDRLRLLENLELEMGQQENQWQQMQTNLDRDSMSQIMSPFQQDPVAETSDLSRESSQRSSRTPSRVVSRRARIRSSMMTDRSKGPLSSRTTSTESSDNSRASVWQQRLAEAQIEYMENAPQLLRKKSLNFLSVSKAHQLGSPTPPDSGESEEDMSSEAESETEVEATSYNDLPQEPSKVPASLWQQPLAMPKAAAGHMWNRPLEDTDMKSGSPEPPAMNVRPAQRRIQTVLPIFTTELWTKSRTPASKRPVVALWGSRLVRPVSIATRRVTQRPQRKSKRVTFLPDIVESPVPLPNKRETLGIFQFPWGETSDQPTFQPAFNPALLAGPALNASLDARARQLENSEQAEYSSSFFDDYDEEDDEMDIESDDDFDETTLWEIASMLNSKNVPSKQSLLPPARPESLVEEFDDEFVGEESNIENAIPPPVTRLTIRPLAMTARPESYLWAAEAASTSNELPTGLPQPEPSVWNALIPANNDIVRSKARSSELLPAIVSKDLWSVSRTPNSSEVATSSMWQNKSVPREPTKLSQSVMWSSEPEVENRRGSGLFVPTDGSVIRTTDANPAALNMAKAPRVSASAVPSISSRALWGPVQNKDEDREWLSTSSGPGLSSSQKMWASALQVPDVPILGLFDVSVPRSSYRVSNATPAAIDMACKPRTIWAPVGELTSTRLWSGCNKLPIERDWISESSVRPESPSIYSASSSGNSSPSSDSSSVKSTSTKASSIWSAVSALNVPAWLDNKSSKKPSKSEPVENKPVSKIPVRQGTPLAPLRESRVFATRDMWEAKAPILEKTPVRRFRKVSVAKDSLPTEASLPPALAARRALLHKHRPAALLNGSWDDALAEAIAGGTPPKQCLPRPVAKKSVWEAALAQAITSSKPKLRRPECTEVMWADALAEAVFKSKIPKPVETLRYDSSVLHPVFFTKSLATNVKDIHPAAFGHVIPKYDPSVLHPVFFTQSLKSTARDIHPAALGYIANETRSTLWTSSPIAISPKSAALWSEDTTAIRKMFVDDFSIVEPVRKALVVKDANLPILESEQLWEAASTTTEQQNWIAASVPEPSAIVQHKLTAPSVTPSPVSPKTCWTPRRGNKLTAQDGMKLWSLEPTSLATSPDIFSHSNAGAVRKVVIKQELDLPALESVTLWQPTESVSVIRNWVLASALVSSNMWTARPSNVEAEDNMSMWIPKLASLAASPDMFAKPSAKPIRKATFEQRSLSVLESQALWQPTEIVAIERKWIIASAPVSAKMWSPKTASSPASPDMFAHLNAGPARKASVEQRLGLPVLDSSALWQPSQIVSKERSWIATPSVETPQTWTPRSQTPESQSGFSSPMWSAKATSAPTSPDMFADMKGGLVKKVSSSRPSALPRLNSTELFKIGSAESSSSNVDWLHSTSTESSPVSLTWTAPSSVQATLPSNMWEASPSSSGPSASLFTNPHSEPWNPKKRDDISVPELESTELWRPSRTVESAKNWLVNKRSSKVDFRY